jgi:GNAT superfamily N-acetyltransferase
MSGAVVRLAGLADREVLVDALVWAADWRDDRGLSPATIAAQPDAWRYLDGWMRSDDFGIVAELDGTAVGAAWARVMPADDPGYGFVEAGVPELTVGLAPEHRGKGTGRLLLVTLLDEARARGVRGMSLSVEDGNVAARRLYVACGFSVVGRVGGSDTMVLWF